MKNKVLFLLLIIIAFPTYVFAYSKSPIEIRDKSIIELQEYLNSGVINSEELVQLYLDRIDAYDNNYNSINQINDNALNEAKQLDEERVNGKVRGLLHGIPIVVKTNIDVVGLSTTAGAKALLDNYPIEDAYVIKKLKDEGAIIIGSTNMSAFAFSASESYSSFGTVHNAYDKSYSSYGSSGGSAVAIALSFATVALGTDTNTSVRGPSSAANLYGFRPTLGLLSRSGVIPYDVTRDTVGILSKYASDSAILLEVMAGIDENDNYTKDAVVSNYTDNLNSTDLSGVKIGVVNDFYVGRSDTSIPINKKTDKGIAKLMGEQIKVLEDLGAEIVYIDDAFYTSSMQSIKNNTMAGSTFCDGFNDYIKGTTGTIRSFRDLTNSSLKVYSLSGYYNCCNQAKNIREILNKEKESFESRVLKYMEEYDIDAYLYPTTKNTISKNGSPKLVAVSSYISSVIGYPALTIPMGFIDGLPYGMEILSKKYTEDILYKIAIAYEKVNDSFISPEDVPTLYDIDENTSTLIDYYMKLNNNSYHTNTEKELLSNTYDYFRNFDDSTVEKNNELISRYKDLEKSICNCELTSLEVIAYLIIGIFMILLSITVIKIKIRKKKKKKYKRVK